MKKLLALLFLAIMILTGCSSSEETSGEIVVWAHMAEGTPEALAYQAGVDRYNEANPDGTQAVIEFIPRDSSGGGYEDKINAAISSGELPDVIAIDSPNLASYVNSGVITPITDYITDEQLAEYIPGSIASNTVNNELYALGAGDATVMLYYNEAYVDPATMSTDVTNPNTWEEIDQMCADLVVENADNPDFVCIDYSLALDEWAPYSLLPLFWSNGVEMMSEDGLVAEGYFNSPEAAKVVDNLKSFYEKGYLSTEATGEIDRFATGNSAFQLDGSWAISYLDTEFPDLNYGVTYYPTSTNWDGTPYVANGSWVFAVTENSQHKEEAAEVVYYMTNVQAGVDQYNAVGSIPNTYAGQEQIMSETSEGYQIAMEQLTANTRPRPISPAYPVFSEQFGLALDAAIHTDVSSQEALNNAIIPLNKELERFANE